MTVKEYRVGVRQWRVLMAILDSDLGAITVRRAREVIGRDVTPANVRTVLAGLTRRHLVEHACSWSGHVLTDPCRLRITEAGACAKLGSHGGWRGGARA